jgi:hypothetical protein
MPKDLFESFFSTKIMETIRCVYCNKNISTNYIDFDGKSYHVECYNSAIELTCCICNTPITGLYYYDEWSNRACDSHNVEFCSSCNRILTTNRNKKVDNRKYCKYCTESCVDTNNIIAKAYQRILKLFNAVEIKAINENVKINLVTNTEIAQLANDTSNSDIMGLTCTYFSGSYFGSQKIFEHRIHILSSLPFIEFESVLAHELLHTWLNENDIKMCQADTEGFCNLGSYLTLSANNNKHSKILISKMEMNLDLVYGEGFRKMQKKLLEVGWSRFMRQLKETNK